MRPFCAMILAIFAVTACVSMPVDKAETSCVREAKLARAPGGEIGVIIDNQGRIRTGAELTISSDYLAGRDPSTVFIECVKQRSGKFPSRSLTQMPEWRP